MSQDRLTKFMAPGARDRLDPLCKNCEYAVLKWDKMLARSGFVYCKRFDWEIRGELSGEFCEEFVPRFLKRSRQK